MNELDFIASLRGLASDPAARGLLDDAAVLEIGGTRLVLTHDMIVEGVHYLPDDPPEDVAWKLLAVNLSDLAAKGAAPIGVLLGFALAGDEDWERGFVAGLGEALAAFAIPLLGGDTVAMPAASPRALGLTALGTREGPVPSRSGARPGDRIWVSGTIGDAGAGLKALRAGADRPELIERYRNPRPRLEAGRKLAPLVSAMLDVSDGLLIDCGRLASASGVAARLDLALLPLSAALIEAEGDDRRSRLTAAIAGDDYELLFTAPQGATAEILALSDSLGLSLSRIGEVAHGEGLRLVDGADPVPLPDRLGWEHQRD